ncbi:MAG: S8 family serine peptidase, partial [Candidatus Hydrogenedentes bacterium]|nr:S8 family serine peptidase [Candidatus Hydrogenedentota bacterium]
MRTSSRMVQGHVLLNLKSAFIFGCIAAYCATVQAEFPWKASTGDASDPYAYQNYLYIGSEQFPPSDLGGDIWKYSSKNACQLYGEDDNRCSQAIVNNPQELYGVTGASVDLAWETTTGRPDVVIAVTDSGIKWNDYGKMIDLARKTFLNRAELPLPQNRSGATVGSYDLNFDGVFNLTDYEEDPRVRDVNATGYLDPEDLIFLFSNGIDADNNGYVDDIAGWDFYEDDNDPYDEVQYGHGSGEAEDSTAEPNNGGGAGVAPNCMVMHMRVGDSFIADINDFAEAVTYATDNGASVVQCALGTLNNSRFAQEAINYA